MNYETHCEYSNPLNYLGNTPTSTMEFWSYQKSDCVATSSFETTELVENASTGASFFISKQVSYGDILVITFLTLFLIFGIFQFLINFIIPKRMNFKR